MDLGSETGYGNDHYLTHDYSRPLIPTSSDQRRACQNACAVAQGSCGLTVATGAPFQESSLVNLACLPLRLDAHARPHNGGIPGFPRLDFRPIMIGRGITHFLRSARRGRLQHGSVASCCASVGAATVPSPAWPARPHAEISLCLIPRRVCNSGVI
jgi:hypothetical protein